MKRIHWLLILLILLVSFAITIAWYLNFIGQAMTRPNNIKTFEITAGQSSSEIIDRLKSQGLIKYPSVVLAYVYTHPILFLPEVYNIPERYTIPTLLRQMATKTIKDQKLTVPEGYSREQIAQLLPTFALSETKFLDLTKGLEGTLFPDTYYVNEKTDEADLVKRMTDRYHEKTDSLKISVNDLILASIVEREGQTDADRPIIAGIYKNRLKIGMALEADPTVQYGKFTDLGLAPIVDGKKNYWAPIKKSDYTEVKSNYNTYLHSGLPPSPICNPGLKSINAVLQSSQTDAYYFFHTASGRLITSRNIDEHNANKAKYL